MAAQALTWLNSISVPISVCSVTNNMVSSAYLSACILGHHGTIEIGFIIIIIIIIIIINHIGQLRHCVQITFHDNMQCWTCTRSLDNSKTNIGYIG